MDALAKAKWNAERTDGDDTSSWVQDGMLYAAIAQAEALQLIAKRLEQWISVQGVGMEVIEAAERGLRYGKENERLLRRIAVLEGEPVLSEFTGEEE